jgi:acetylornithine/N-succinyldiaminopimelate aminotransferase
MNTIEIENNLGITFCNRQSIAIEKGEGNYVWDESGVKYLDFTSGWGVTCLGHSHPVITAALTDQAKKIIQNPNSGFTYSPSRAKLLSVLSKVLPQNLSKIFFANSGAEANDAAIKLARKMTGKTKVVSTKGSFHGRTFNTLSVSVGHDNTRQYLPSLPANRFVPFGDIESMRVAVDCKTAAVILEPVQGEGGVRIPNENYLMQVAELCRRTGALLIIDEIQTGFCRTGKFFALEHSGQKVAPDILTMGKGIAGGFPFAAFAVSAEVDARIHRGDHGGTFCGNPLGCAVSTAVVNYLVDNNIAKHVAVTGERLLAGLQLLAINYPGIISSVRGKGLLTAIELQHDSLVNQLTEHCLARGLLVTPTRNAVVRLIPALIVGEEELTLGMEILNEVLAVLNSQQTKEMVTDCKAS